MSEFEHALSKTLVFEGGYVNHPKDPGGPTNRGVTQRVYDDFRKSIRLAPQSVKSITTPEVDAIYKRKYWDLFKGDKIPAGVGYVVFDGAVNSGVAQAVKWLQRALAPYYKGVVDGLVGQGTLDAINEHPNHDALVAAMCKLRLAFMKALKGWATFGRGWASRVSGVLLTGQAWASGTVAPKVSFVDGGQAKAVITDAISAPPKAPGDIAAGGGGVGAAIGQAIDQISPYATSPFITNVVVGLTVAGVLVTAVGLAYRFWAARKKARLEEALGT